MRWATFTDTIESAFSLLKRGVYGTFHKVSIKHLGRYCNEFSYRFNRRGEQLAMFSETMKHLTRGKALPYANSRLRQYRSLRALSALSFYIFARLRLCFEQLCESIVKLIFPNLHSVILCTSRTGGRPLHTRRSRAALRCSGAALLDWVIGSIPTARSMPQTLRIT